jgi:hypothetical protein
MKHRLFSTALSCAILASASPALADDPNDPAMRDRAAREADAAEIRGLNLEQARYVQERDARNAQGWQAYREQPAAQAEYQRQLDRYEQSRADYEAQLAAWRRAVERCRQGDHRSCR